MSWFGLCARASDAAKDLPLIDLHCHILPGIDDGPADIVECMEMARLADVGMFLWNFGRCPPDLYFIRCHV